jgi:hypothetical protein
MKRLIAFIGLVTVAFFGVCVLGPIIEAKSGMSDRFPIFQLAFFFGSAGLVFPVVYYAIQRALLARFQHLQGPARFRAMVIGPFCIMSVISPLILLFGVGVGTKLGLLIGRHL